MNTTKFLNTSAWLLSGITLILALAVWWPATENLTTYSLFPLFGIIAFGLMWAHYITGALKRYLGLPHEKLSLYYQLTGYVVLFCILIHPFLLDLQLFLDGNGLPPFSRFEIYTEMAQKTAIFIGTVSLVFFLMFELHRFFSDRSWWKYVEWANIAAMFGILYHGFTLGTNIMQPWFKVIWGFYAISLIVAVVYTEFYKRRNVQVTDKPA